MIEKLHEFEKNRRKRNFRLGVFVGVVSVCTAAVIAYAVTKTVKGALVEAREAAAQEENNDQPVEQPVIENQEEAAEIKEEEIKEEA